MFAMSRKLLIGSVLVLAVLVIGTSLFARGLFLTTLNKQAVYQLDQNWAAMKGYLRIEGVSNQPVEAHWYYDTEDPDESFIVGRLQRGFLLTDSSGTNVLAISSAYQDIGKEPAALIQSRVRDAVASSSGKAFYDRRYADGASYHVRAGVIFDEQHRTPYYVAIATPLTASRRALMVFTLVLVGALAFAVLVGWALNRIVRR